MSFWVAVIMERGTLEKVVDNDSLSVVGVETVVVNPCSEDFPEGFVGLEDSYDKKRISGGDNVQISQISTTHKKFQLFVLVIIGK
jgi:hypothetical protein